MIKAIICDILGVLVDTIEDGEVNKKLVNFLIENKEIYGKLIFYSNSGNISKERFKKLIPELFDIIDKGYFASNFEFLKPSKKGLQHILNESNLKAQEVVFIDDNHSNIQEAEKLGMETILYYNFEDISTLKSLLYP